MGREIAKTEAFPGSTGIPGRAMSILGENND